MTFDEIAAFLSAVPEPSEERYRATITDVASPQTAGSMHIVFAQDAESLFEALNSRAGVILANVPLRDEESNVLQQSSRRRRILWVQDARLAFAQVGEHLLPSFDGRTIHATAMIADDCRMGERVRVGPGVVIERDVELGDGCQLGPRVVVHAGTLLGRNVAVKAGAILGSAGFGFVRNASTGDYLPFPQRGRLVIEDDVSIGANSTIDRGALGETRIGRGTKIDNLVHIAHNCTIGSNVVIAAQTGIAGSSTIGDGAIIAGQVGIADHVTIGKGVILGAKAGVPSNKNLQGAGQVFWGIPARPIQQYLRELARSKRSLD